jgi:hypothetical protein
MLCLALVGCAHRAAPAIAEANAASALVDAHVRDADEVGALWVAPDPIVPRFAPSIDETGTMMLARSTEPQVERHIPIILACGLCWFRGPHGGSSLRKK